MYVYILQKIQSHWKIFQEQLFLFLFSRTMWKSQPLLYGKVGKICVEWNSNGRFSKSVGLIFFLSFLGRSCILTQHSVEKSEFRSGRKRELPCCRSKGAAWERQIDTYIIGGKSMRRHARSDDHCDARDVTLSILYKIAKRARTRSGSLSIFFTSQKPWRHTDL